MEDGNPKNSALTTTLAFHYQVLIGLEQCFSLQDGQSIWFEKDGDVSLVGKSSKESKQTEVKDYVIPLTDHHKNLWKTLKNWLAPEFDHGKYGVLVLHTTQAFGVTTNLMGWNSQDANIKLKVLEEIYNERSEEEINAEKPKPIVRFQKEVMETDKEELKEILAKVVLITEAKDKASIRNLITNQLWGIPKSNKQSYIQGLVGFVYESADENQWEISKRAFDNKCIELTSEYSLKQFTLPLFKGYIATEKDIDSHIEKSFVQKIQGIEYDDVIPEAVGNWIELHNSLNEELEGAPQFRTTTNQYQRQLVTKFKRKHAKAKRNCTDPIKDSKDFYDDIIGESASPIQGYPNPPLEYKNGLIHDAMDDEERELKWRVKL